MSTNDERLFFVFFFSLIFRFFLCLYSQKLLFFSTEKNEQIMIKSTQKYSFYFEVFCWKKNLHNRSLCTCGLDSVRFEQIGLRKREKALNDCSRQQFNMKWNGSKWRALLFICDLLWIELDSEQYTVPIITNVWFCCARCEQANVMAFCLCSQNGCW